jgi:hypothetical protein
MIGKFFNSFSHFFIRYRYPCSTPEEVASDLGLNLTNKLSFAEFIAYLTNPEHKPAKILKFMPRERAENLFQKARRKEKFRHNSLFSYYFNEGWMEFILQFDDQSRLRRLYILHKDLKQKYEIPIS